MTSQTAVFSLRTNPLQAKWEIRVYDAVSLALTDRCMPLWLQWQIWPNAQSTSTGLWLALWRP